MDLQFDPQWGGLAALGTVAQAAEPPDSLADLSEMSRLLQIPEAMLALQPEQLKKQILARALARNPGLLRFARQSPLNASMASRHAREALASREAFANLATSGGLREDPAWPAWDLELEEEATPVQAGDPASPSGQAPGQPSTRPSSLSSSLPSGLLPDSALQETASSLPEPNASGQSALLITPPPAPALPAQPSPEQLANGQKLARYIARAEEGSMLLEGRQASAASHPPAAPTVPAGQAPAGQASAGQLPAMELPPSASHDAPAPGQDAEFALLNDRFHEEFYSVADPLAPVPAANPASQIFDEYNNYNNNPPASGESETSLTDNNPDINIIYRNDRQIDNPSGTWPADAASPQSLQAVPQAQKSALGKAPSALDYVLDPFRNFANGWLDMARSVMGAGLSLSDLTAGRDSALSAWFQNWIKSLGKLELETSRADSFAGRLARDVVRSTPQLAAQIGLWLGAGPAAATGYMFSSIYGGDYLKHVSQGISPGNAAFAGLVDAALQASLERLGLHSLLGGASLSHFTRNLGKYGLLEAARAGGRGALSEGLTEAMQHAPEYLTDWWAQSSRHNSSLSDRLRWTFDRALDARNLAEGTAEALYQGLVGGILGGAAGSGHNVLARRRLDPEIRQLLAGEEKKASAIVRRLALEQALEKAGQATARISDPLQARQILAHSLPEDMRQALISASDLSSLLAENPQAAPRVLEALGRELEEINQAIATGSDLEVDLAALISSRSGEAAKARELLRLEPEGPTLAQASAWNPQERLEQVMRVLNQEEDLEGFSPQERQEEAAREAKRLKLASAKADRECRRLTNEMRAAGLTELEAKQHTALVRAHALTWWKRFGADPESLLSRWRIERATERLPEGPATLTTEEVPPPPPEEDLPDWMRGDEPPAPTEKILRGQACITQSRRIIRLFEQRDVSTLGHEASHLFVDDLLAMARDNGSQALDLLGQRLDDAAGQAPETVRDIRTALDAALAEGGDLAASLRELAREQTKRGKQYRARLDELQSPRPPDAPEAPDNAASSQNGDVQDSRLLAWQLTSDLELSRKLARHLSDAANHLEALSQAREDAASLAAHAGLDGEAAALARSLAGGAPGRSKAAEKAYASLQEAAASAFVQYLASGSAPSARLGGAFGRMSSWLKALWSRYRGVRAEELDPQLIAVMDRLLATDAEMARQEDLESLIRKEKLFIEDAGIDPRDAAEMRELLART